MNHFQISSFSHVHIFGMKSLSNIQSMASFECVFLSPTPFLPLSLPLCKHSRFFPLWALHLFQFTHSPRLLVNVLHSTLNCSQKVFWIFFLIWQKCSFIFQPKAETMEHSNRAAISSLLSIGNSSPRSQAATMIAAQVVRALALIDLLSDDLEQFNKSKRNQFVTIRKSIENDLNATASETGRSLRDSRSRPQPFSCLLLTE